MKTIEGFGKATLPPELPGRVYPNYRDTGTGKYVSKQYAEKHPKTTVKETDKKKKSGNRPQIQQILFPEGAWAENK